MASACVSIRKPRLKAGIVTGRNVPVINDNFMSTSIEIQCSIKLIVNAIQTRHSNEDEPLLTLGTWITSKTT